MPNVFVVYPPGAGGNHVKNLLCLSGEFVNSNELDVAVYDAQDRAPGEVYCVGGRNLQPVFFDRIQRNPGSSSVLPAHFGELVQHRASVAQVPDIRAVIITVSEAAACARLQQRQNRLGQTVHPYWLQEELTWCYRSEMYMKYFGWPTEHCLEISLLDLWHSSRWCSAVLEPIEHWLGIHVPRREAMVLHRKWMRRNFGV